MTQSLPTIDSALARRLAGPRPAPDAGGLLETARALGCIQLDPISAVDRSHRLVWFSRVGPYDRAELDRVVYQDRQMFEYWAHCASYVLTEDYPLHAMYMRTWRTVGKGQYERARQWVKKHDVLSKHLLRELKQHGPVPSRLLEEMGERPARATGGWSSWRVVRAVIRACGWRSSSFNNSRAVYPVAPNMATSGMMVKKSQYPNTNDYKRGEEPPCLFLILLCLGFFL